MSATMRPTRPKPKITVRPAPREPCHRRPRAERSTRCRGRLAELREQRRDGQPERGDGLPESSRSPRLISPAAAAARARSAWFPRARPSGRRFRRRRRRQRRRAAAGGGHSALTSSTPPARRGRAARLRASWPRSIAHADRDQEDAEAKPANGAVIASTSPR